MSINMKKESQCGAGKLPQKIFKGKKGTKRKETESGKTCVLQSFRELKQALLEELRRALNVWNRKDSEHSDIISQQSLLYLPSLLESMKRIGGSVPRTSQEKEKKK